MPEILVARPTPVNRDVYIKFGNNCRSNDREVHEVLVDLMQLYIQKGEKIFKIV